ncbi:ran-binding protein 3-like isoform 2-T2 [Leptodactylus fuscus]|uniref:ran-binding protein 3-like isoform X2 n=1 Tax=Leptodactylus fuscus TaxID=238119 RepID=UPI003F4ED6FD
MRNQKTPIIRENVFYPEIEPLCNDSAATPRHSPKVAMCFTANGLRPTTGDELQVVGVESGVCNLESQAESPREKSLLAQPVFVFEKKDRPFKRHAGDLTTNAENSLCVVPEKRLRSSSFTFRPTQPSIDHSVLDRRVRSSSFTLLTSFPPNQSLIKKNVFMPSTLVQEQSCSAGAGSLHSWSVIRPATLQAPSITISRDVEGKEASAISAKEHPKTLEERSVSRESNTAEPKSSPRSTDTSGMEVRMQPFEQTFMTQKYNVDFVFGENMERRVMSPERPMASQPIAPKREFLSTRVSCNRSRPYQRRRSLTSLMESAAAYTSRPKLKYELDQVDIVTGEESERNVLQINCKLFVLDKENQMWTERGYGYLRVNDTAASCNAPFRSRIVMRNHGNLKLILNSIIFNGMKLERANRKCVRITATDLTDNSVKIFLVQAGIKDAARLYAAIHHRLIALRSQRDQGQEKSSPMSKAKEDSRIQLLNSDSEEEEEEDDEMLLYPRRTSDHHQWIRRQPVLYS